MDQENKTETDKDNKSETDKENKPDVDKESKAAKKTAKPNYFEQLLGGTGGRPAKNAVAGGGRSKHGNPGKRMGKGSARGR